MEYTLQGVAVDLRHDGRSRLDFRPLALEIGLMPQAFGSARLSAGAADVLVGVSGELSEPDAAAPDEGRIVISVDLGPGDVAAGLPQYSSGGGGGGGGGGGAAEDKILWLEAALRQLYSRQSVSAALRALCIAPGAQCWELRVHATLLRADGCPLDAIALAVRCALEATRIPKVLAEDGAGGADELARAAGTVAATAAAGGGGGEAAKAAGSAPRDLELDDDLDESLAFDASGLPLCVTLATLGPHLVADCTASERGAAGAALTLATNAQGEVCAVVGGSGFGVHLAPLADALKTAEALCARLHAEAGAELAAAARAAESRGGPTSDAVVGLLAF